MASFKRIALLLAAIVAISMVVETKAQIPDCATKLTPCANFFNSTKPPESCCTPLRETIQNQRDCLCNLYSNPGLISAFGINITQALELPKYCGVPSDTSLCGKASSPVPSSVPGNRGPPGTPGTPGTSGTPGSDGNRVGMMAWTGASALLLLWASASVL
ncbi:hypothetical protein IFM89_034314 [Coptis chinensis]|uniref:Bifunctional inhibitor/plant lipid transfer protein/seed storage helical domain-containing protein n=1 Tax=Coptis chinensis TaxID=261450 RepID=A0A835IIG2_9MAGN|nr:hypothetical protein IFM89_034314 [Coptis chinensis]